MPKKREKSTARLNKSQNQKILSKKQTDGKVEAFIASFFTIIGFLVAIIAWKNDKYIMYYANHGLILFIGQIIILLISALPFFGNLLLSPVLWVLWAILWIITWVNALSGERKKTFIITDISEKISFN